MSNGKINVSECFLSLQGEGLYAGEPTVFVRFQGCNLLTGIAVPNSGFGCRWCDTKYAQLGEGGQLMSVEDIRNKVRDLAPYFKFWCCITGGEPLFQPEALLELVDGLKDWGYRVEVETNGTLPKPVWYTKVDSWVADIKCPSSGVASLVDNWFDMRVTDQIKLVVGTPEDLEYAREVINQKRTRSPKVLVSPVVPLSLDIDRKWLQEVWTFCVEEKVRFSLQIHKIAWENKKGV